MRFQELRACCNNFRGKRCGKTGLCIALMLWLAAILLAWWWWNDSHAPDKAAGKTAESLAPAKTAESSLGILPLPQSLPVNTRLAALGQRLFHEARLSGNGQFSCATCHDLKTSGANNERTKPGINHAATSRNTPTVFNAAFNFRQFWDGRARTLEEQAGVPITDPREMGAKWDNVLDTLREDTEYSREFAALFANGVSKTAVTQALAEFERTLITPNAPFDRFLRGEMQAIPVEAKKGWVLFQQRGCIACHQGINIGGNLFQVMGVMGNFFIDRKRDDVTDLGRYNVTGLEADKYVFKVPSLRNVILTAPYFHDGSVDTLVDAVRLMGRFQLGVELSDEEVRQLVAFLSSLTGDIKADKPAHAIAMTRAQ